MDLVKEIAVFEGKEKGLSVATESQRVDSINLIKKAKEKRVIVVEFFKETKSKAHEAWKAIVAQEKGFLDKLDTFEGIAKRAIEAYDAEKERIRLIKEEKLRSLANEQAEKERKALENRATRTKDPEKREALLIKLEAVQPVMVSLPSDVKRQEGESSRKIWDYRITDITKLDKSFMIPNNILLKGLARNEVSRKNPPNGVEFYFETTLSIRS